MAKLLGFEQDPEAPAGAGTFHFDSGQSQYAYAPDIAEQAGAFKAKLDAAPDNRTALNTAELQASLRSQGQQAERADIDAIAGIGAGNDARALATADGAVQKAVAQAGQGGTVPASIALEAPAAPGDMAAQARDAMGQRAAADLIRGTKRVAVPGSPGVDPHRMIERGVMVPTTSSEVTETAGALPYSEEAARERLGAAKGVRDAQLAEIDLNRQQTQNQLNAQRAAAPILEQRAAEAELAQKKIQNAYRADRSRLQQELDDYEQKAHVDPDRYFKDRGIFATIGMAIAQGLGAYGSAVTGAPNFAYEIVQKAIERDISAQREEIETGRVSRRNKLAQMMDTFGYDLPQAEAATRLAMNKSAENQANLFANESKLPHYQIEAQKFNALALQEAVKQEQAFQAASIGKQTRTVNQAFLQPKAATAPGYIERPLTPEEEATRAKNLPKGTGQDVQDLDPKDRLALLKTYGEKKTDFASLRASYDDLAQAYGYKVDWKKKAIVDPKTGEPVDPNESGLFGKNPDIAGVGIRGPDITRSQAGKRAEEARAKAAAITGKALSGASVSPQQAEFIQSYLLGGTDAAALRGLQRAIVDMGQVETDTEAGFDPETRRAYDTNRRDISRGNRAAPPPVKVSDY